MKRTLYILALILFLVLITLAGKVEFLYYNRDVCFFTIGDVVEVLWQGLPLDLRVIAIMVIPVWVITAFSLYFVRMPLRRIAGPYLFVAVFLSTDYVRELEIPAGCQYLQLYVLAGQCKFQCFDRLHCQPSRIFYAGSFSPLGRGCRNYAIANSFA